MDIQFSCRGETNSSISQYFRFFVPSKNGSMGDIFSNLNQMKDIFVISTKMLIMPHTSKKKFFFVITLVYIYLQFIILLC